MVEHTAGIMEQLAHLDTAIDEPGAGCRDIGQDEMESLCRARPGRGASLAEDDRAGRARRRELDDPNLAIPGEVSVESPTQAAVKALGTIDARNRDHDNLKLH